MQGPEPRILLIVILKAGKTKEAHNKKLDMLPKL